MASIQEKSSADCARTEIRADRGSSRRRNSMIGGKSTVSQWNSWPESISSIRQKLV
jgi:hypothetical protein